MYRNYCLRRVSLLLVAVTSYHMNQGPFYLLGSGLLVLGYVQRLRRDLTSRQHLNEQEQQQQQRLKWVATGLGLVSVAGLVWMFAQVASLPK